MVQQHLVRRHWPDMIGAVLLGGLAAVASFYGVRQLDSVILSWETRDVWFHSDLSRVFSSMTDRWGPQFRTYVHPLFPLLTAPAVYALRRGAGFETVVAVRLMVATTAAVWLSSIFVILRLIGLRRLDAILYSLVALVSGASMFWFTVPETYSFGSVSILLAVLLVALSERTPLPSWSYIAVSALTLSYTITNWMAGLLATFSAFPWRRAAQMTTNAFCLVVGVWALQKLLFPDVQFFLDINPEEGKFILNQDSGGPLHILRSFFAYSMIVPAIQHVPQLDMPNLQWPLMRVQTSPLSSLSAWGVVGLVAWGALLLLGAWGWITMTQSRRFRTVLGLLLAGQLSLHLLYGQETFLYSLHFMPLLVLLAGLSSLTAARTMALALAAVLVVAGGVNNWMRFKEVAAFVATQGPERHQVQRAMRSRTDDPWPRGTGHVLLAWPGSTETDKGYHEPGGSFSPGVGSFGLSLWITNRHGGLEATSDSIPMNELTQRFMWHGASPLPGVWTSTRFYTAEWRCASPRRWELQLAPKSADGLALQLLVRSVGPAGGPIISLRWENDDLLVNNRWRLRVRPVPTGFYIGQEGDAGWMTAAGPALNWTDQRGWGFARLTLPAAREVMATVEDTHARPAQPTLAETIRSPIDMDLPDDRFVTSFEAQLAHLLMGLVDGQTRPGDPMDYPLPWQRDAAYIVAALARAGHVSVARELAVDLAERDFFGGFGPEADAPGLAIWALEQIAMQLSEPAYDRWLWPHVRRKADWIVKMSETDRALHADAPGLIWYRLDGHPERTLVAEPNRNGLIVGRIDNHRPVLYVNAISYRGLLDAASLADRLGQTEEASRWRVTARRIKAAWDHAFRLPDLRNERTFSAGFWPSAMPDTPLHTLHRYLDLRWKQRRTPDGAFQQWPVWPAFELAEAHQWLAVGTPDRAWKTVEWFWQHQVSPGLYTWWEGEGMPVSEWKDASHRGTYSFTRWRQVRGWTDPPHVTPQYWVAAQMVLLQLDMLAMLDRSTNPPTILLGAGLPKNWVDRPHRVGGFPIPGGLLDWRWDRHTLHARITGQTPLQVRPGPPFPAGTVLTIEHSRTAFKN